MSNSNSSAAIEIRYLKGLNLPQRMGIVETGRGIHFTLPGIGNGGMVAASIDALLNLHANIVGALGGEDGVGNMIAYNRGEDLTGRVDSETIANLEAINGAIRALPFEYKAAA